MEQEVEELLIRHYIQSILISRRSGFSVVYEKLPPEVQAQLDAQDEEYAKELEKEIREEVRSGQGETDLPGWLSLILFGQWKVLPQEEEILRRAPPGWIKAKIMDELERQKAQKKELEAAERGEETPRILGSSYEERVAKGELKKYAPKWEEYERYMDEKIRLRRIPPVQSPEE